MAVHKKYNKSVLGRGLDDLERGQGLDALIDTNGVRTQGSSTINEGPLNEISPNPNQPRRDFDEDALREEMRKVLRHEFRHHIEGRAGVRPLLLNKTPEEVETFIKEQLKQREPFYLKAQHIFDIDVIDDYDKIQNAVKKLRLQLGI